ncbi:MAG: hypothetical protein ABSG96_10475 [Terracidiphilus sp.]
MPATLIYPTPGSTFRTTDVYFVWSAGTDVSAYDLHLSAVAPGGWDLYASEHVTSTFRTAPLLPTNGEKVYARLYSIIGGVTYYNDYTYTAELANPGGPITSPPGSNMLVTVTSPSHDQTVEGSTTIVATAAQTSLTDGGIAFWGIYDSGNLLWVDTNPDPSINVNLALSAGPHNLQVSAYDNSFTASTATIPVVSSSSGVTVSWQACMYTDQGQQYQAMRFVPGQPVTGMLQSEMFNNSNCAPAQWTDQLNDIGASSTWGGNGYLYWFIHRPNIPGVSAVWTVGNQTSGCVNYSTAPPC